MSLRTMIPHDTREKIARESMMSLVETVPPAIIRQTFPNSPEWAWISMRHGGGASSPVSSFVGEWLDGSEGGEMQPRNPRFRSLHYMLCDSFPRTQAIESE